MPQHRLRCVLLALARRVLSPAGLLPQYAHGDQHVRSLDIHLLAHTDIDFPGRVHSSNWPMKSSIEPTFSDDHMLIDEYGSEYTSTFLPRSPCASRTIKHFAAKIAESRKVAYAATGCSPGTIRLATYCRIGYMLKAQLVTHIF